MINNNSTPFTKFLRFSLFPYLLLACNPGGDAVTSLSNVAASHDESEPTVEVIFPEYRHIERRISIAGTAMPNRKVTLCALESGVVRNLHKEIGDRVRKGEILAVLDHPRLLRQHEKTGALMTAKKAEYERLLAVRDQSSALTPAHVFDAAKGEYLALQAEWNELAERIGYLNVAAPFPGTVTRRFVDLGTVLTGGFEDRQSQALYEIQQTDPIRLHIPLPEADIPWVGLGTNATVTFPELPQKKFIAKVNRMANALDPQSKTMDVELDLANASGQILPGMYAVVEMEIARRDSVLSLPVMAKMLYRDQPHLLIVRDGIAERVVLQEGITSRDYFEVLNKDIGSQTMVVLQGKQLAEAGRRVIPISKDQKKDSHDVK